MNFDDSLPDATAAFEKHAGDVRTEPPAILNSKDTP